MGQYSLNYYEIYKTYKVRPKPLFTAPDNTGRGQFHIVSFQWSELEPDRGDYQLKGLDKALSETVNSLLVIEPNSPIWVKMQKEDCFVRLIRKIGSHIQDVQSFVGIMITSVSQTHKEWDAYVEAFAHVTLITDLQDSQLIRYLQKKNVKFGLSVSCNEENWLECCEAFARYDLQHVWETRPVILQLTDEQCGIEIRRETLRWHAALSNQLLDIGYRIEVRRLMYPKNVSSQGVLPVRFWIVNTGTAPCYHDFNLNIELSKDEKRFVLPLYINSKQWLPGDITHNEMVKLPALESGIYTLSIGLFFPDNEPIRLSIQEEQLNGVYQLGHIKVDGMNRDELNDIWEHYYPEGYYPLEDPEEPNS